MKMPTIVGIFIFISRENFLLSWVEDEKSFITSGPGHVSGFKIAYIKQWILLLKLAPSTVLATMFYKYLNAL